MHVAVLVQAQSVVQSQREQPHERTQIIAFINQQRTEKGAAS